jgi:aminoglycoside/choline kinase family phosphotransferase
MDILKHLFEEHFGFPVEHVEPLQGGLGGSGRSIFRLAGENASAIGVLYDVREENVAFLEFSRHFRRHGLPVPEIYAEDVKRGAYLEQDLGDTTLFDFLSRNRQGDEIPPVVIDAYREVVAVLPRFQVEAGRDLNYKICYPRASFDRQSIAWDLNYFKYYFLRLSGIPFNEQDLETDFGRLTRFLLTSPREYFLYRDFQSRNVMLVANKPWFLDYQGGRKGALQYDIASLLYDAKADLPPALRQHLLDRYLEAVHRYVDISPEQFMRHYYAFVYVRLMQALGAYGFRGFYERKPHFLQSVPFALKNLSWLLNNVELPVPIPALTAAFRSMLLSDKLLNLNPTAQRSELKGTGALIVRIFSFSFHQGGPPKDDTGNGGGFVFDARGIPNPGREDRFKELTGRDAPVIEYLNQQESAHKFLAHAMALVDATVDNYKRRGFSNLMISFGCTGGQHRSVYLAEHLASHLRQKSGVEVLLRHLQLEKLAGQHTQHQAVDSAALENMGR